MDRDTFPPDQGSLLPQGDARTLLTYTFEQLEDQKRTSQVLGKRIEGLTETVRAVVPPVNLRENQYGDPVLRGSYALVRDTRAPLFATESTERQRIRKMRNGGDVDFLEYDAMFQALLGLPDGQQRQDILALYKRLEQAKRDMIQAAREMEGELAAFAEEVLGQGTEEYRMVKPVLEDFKSVELRAYFRN